MKKILNYAIVAALALGATSCTKEANIGGENDGGIAENGKKLVFTLPVKPGNTTYAEIATADEKTLDLSDTWVYMFNATTNRLEAVITDLRPGTNGDKTTVTVPVDDAWDGDKKFYFLGNASAAGDIDLNIALNTTEAAFLNKITERQTGHLGTPLLMSGVAPVVTDIANAPAIIPGDVELYRSVARFDISNDVDANNVEIKSIHIHRAAPEGFLFGYFKGIRGAGNVDLPSITVDVAVAGKQEQESLFYLYPTRIATSFENGALITLIGDVGGEEKIFSLRPQDENGNYIDFEIEANKRYLISAVNPENLTFNLIAEDWDEGESIVGLPEGGLGSVGLIAGSPVLTDGTTTVDAGYTFAVASTGAEFSFGVMSSSAGGVDNVAVVPVTGDGFVSYDEVKIKIETSTEKVLTYAVPYYKTTVTVTIDGSDIQESDNFISIIELTDKGTGKVSEVKVFHAAEGVAPEEMFYPGTQLKPVKMTYNGVTAYFAPVNVGATEIGSSRDVKHIGYFFQWGRNIPFDWNNFSVSSSSTGLTFEEAMNTADFIGVAAGNNNVDWLAGHDSGLWFGEKAQGPCPKGWRVPVNSEMQIVRYAEYSYDESTEMYVFSGDNEGEKLHMHVKGRIGNTGNVYADYTRYWSGSTNNAYQSYTFNLYKDGRESPISTTSGVNRAAGYPVRCVLDIQE